MVDTFREDCSYLEIFCIVRKMDRVLGKLVPFYIFIRFVNLNIQVNFEYFPLKNILEIFRMTDKYWPIKNGGGQYFCENVDTSH